MEQKSDFIGTSELDKFKRRMIRSVAGMLIQQKIPESDVWKEMKKVMGCDCKILWERMKALTTKKLNRLLTAEDRTELIPVIARMTLTDWQLFDQILVHENIDVIGLANMSSNKSESRVLIDLFGLVQRFDIEYNVGDYLTEAWTAATLYYNSKGHQCSPMLLQKRWYQLKSDTRSRFYHYWHAYRGNKRLMPKAEQFKPTILQRAIAKRFPEVVTHKFLDWESGIKEGLIILPDHFQRIKWNKCKRKVPKENTPDIVVVEPVVETIDLLQESDPEQENDQVKDVEVNDQEESVTRVKIKVEPDDSIHDEVTVIKEKPSKTSTVIAQIQEQESLMDNINADIDNLKAAENSLIHLAVDYESKLREVENEMFVDDNEEKDNNPGNIPKITNVFGNAPMTDETLSIIENLAKRNTVSTKETDTNATVTHAEEERSDKTGTSSVISMASHIDIEDDINESDIKIETEVLDEEDKKIKNISGQTRFNTDVKPIVAKAENITMNSNMSQLNIENINLSSFGEIPDSLNFADDGIEIIDSATEYTPNTEIIVKEEKVEFDANIQIKTENTDHSSSEQSDGTNDNQEFKLDEKLFLDPVVYTRKLDDMSIFKNKEFNAIDVKTLINKIIDESKPISDRSVDAEKVRIDKKRVSLSSYLFQKPKHREYNPIKLCKNPDFNTRLKRLTAGFLSSVQNRVYLKACMPLTIDVTKAFESKLIDNTMYLKKPDNNCVIVIDEDEVKTSVMPSMISIQSIIDAQMNSVLKCSNLSNNQPTTSRAEDAFVVRANVIHVPDIIKIIRINQTSLTAEISPIPTQNTSNAGKSPQTDVPHANSTNSGFNDSAMLTSGSESIVSTDNLNPCTTNLNINQEHVKGEVIDITEEPKKSRILLNLLKTPTVMPIETSQKEHTLQSDADSGTQPQTDQNQPKKKPPARTLWRPLFRSNFQARTEIKNVETNIDEFLLTKDTLDKMLFLFNGEKSDYSNKKKPYKYGRSSLLSKYGDKKNRKKDVQFNTKDVTPISLDVHPTPVPIEKKDNKEVKKLDKTKSNRLITRIVSLGDVSSQKQLYCCWARERLVLKRNFSNKRGSRHTCLYLKCTCCCADELADYNAKMERKIFKINSVSQGVLKKTKEAESQTSNDEIEIVDKVIKDSNLNDPNATINIITETKPTEISDPESGVEDIVASEIDVAETVVTDVLTQLSPLDDITVPTISGVYSLNSAPVAELMNNSDPVIVVPSSEVIGPSASTQNNLTVTSNSITPVIENASSNTNTNLIRPLFHLKSNVNQRHTSNTQITENPSQRGKRRKEICKVRSGPNNKGMVLVLNNERMLDVPYGSPIFLGRNKVLLTNIKFPEFIQQQNNSLLKPQYQKSAVPAVHLVLYTDGKLKYITTPEANASLGTTEMLPNIITSIQQQNSLQGEFTFTKNSTPIDEIVNISDDETMLSDSESSYTPNCSSSTKDTTAANDLDLETLNTDQQNNKTNSSEKTNSEVKVMEVNHETKNSLNKVCESESTSEMISDSNRTAATDELNVDIPKENMGIANNNADNQNKVITEYEDADLHNIDPALDKQSAAADNTDIVDVTINHEKAAMVSTNAAKMNLDATIHESTKPDINLEVKNASTSKKTILSDLMEMSGISPEDAAPVQVESTQDNVISLQNSKDPIPVITASQPKNSVQMLYELSTVTSFIQLKYACENGATFFKLDFDTGIVVPINVCIKKRANISSPKPIAPKTTIDLTEDNDLVTTNVTTTILRKDKEIVKTVPWRNLNYNKHPLKAVTIFKAVHRPRILKKPTEKNYSSDVQIYKGPPIRKRNCQLAYTITIDRNTLPPKNVSPKSKIDEDVQILSESSDEEPLSIKAKRKRMEELKETVLSSAVNLSKENEKDQEQIKLNEKTSIGEVPVEERPIGEMPIEEMSIEETPIEEMSIDEMPIEETPIDEMPTAPMPTEPTPIEPMFIMVQGNNALPYQVAPGLEFSRNPNDDDNEDCILGV